MKKSLDAITKSMKKLSLKVNESKTEVCLFHHNDVNSIKVIINDVAIEIKTSKCLMYILRL